MTLHGASLDQHDALHQSGMRYHIIDADRLGFAVQNAMSSEWKPELVSWADITSGMWKFVEKPSD